MVILAGLAATLYEANRARQNELRAEKRFNDVRALANSLIFEVHDSIETLPGATAARKIILERALQYLDSLARESSGDAPLQRELATAYTRIGSLQGSTLDSNLGQEDQALSSFQKALAIRGAVAKANPGNIKDQLDLAVAHHAMARMLSSAGGPGAMEQDEQALTVTAQLLKADPSNFDVLRERGIEYEVLGDLQEEPSRRIDAFKSSMAISQELLKARPDDKRVQRGLAIISVKIGNELRDAGSFSEALQYTGSGVDLFEGLARDQSDARVRRELAVASFVRGSILEAKGDSSGALAAYRRNLGIVEPMAEADPQNAELQLDVAGGSLSVGRVLFRLSRQVDAERLLMRSIRLYEENLARNPSDSETPELLGSAEIWMGELLTKKREFYPALENYRKGIAVLEKIPAGVATADTRGDIATARVRMAALLAQMGNEAEAMATYTSALATAESLAAANPPKLRGLYAAADAYFGIGELSRKAAHWQQAGDWYLKSAGAWRTIGAPWPISPGYLPCGSPAEVARAIRQCELALHKQAPAFRIASDAPPR